MLALANQKVASQNSLAEIARVAPPWIAGDYHNIPSLEQWSADVLKLYERQYLYYEEDTSLQKMSRCMNMMQQLRYYGRYFYSVKELSVEQFAEAETDVPLRTVSDGLPGEVELCKGTGCFACSKIRYQSSVSHAHTLTRSHAHAHVIHSPTDDVQYMDNISVGLVEDGVAV